MTTIKLYFNWFKRMFFWLVSTKNPVFGVISVALVIFLSYLTFDNWEQRFRISGMVLQLLGVGTVVVGLIDIHNLFGGGGVTEYIKNVFASFPRLKKIVDACVGMGVAVATTAESSGVSTVSSPPRTTEERINLIEQQLRNLSKSQSALEVKVNTNAEEQASALERERRAREKSIEKIEDLIREVSVGGIHIELMGIWWLFLGIILATAPKELVCLFFCLPN